MMTHELKNRNISRSCNTVYKYMRELGLRSITRPKYSYIKKGKPHKIFPNLLNQDFHAIAPNQKWCIDFTYLNLSNGEKCYNCAILDLYDRSIVSSVTSSKINSELAIKTLKSALKNFRKSRKIILHSDQGSQFTSKSFIEFCSKNNVVQSMSRAGCPYDNAPMERFFNTLKHEFFYLFNFKSKDNLINFINDFIFIRYNHTRPHSFNGGLTPTQKRFLYQPA